jgi:tetratricopeptide (TPR) repeat protein
MILKRKKSEGHRYQERSHCKRPGCTCELPGGGHGPYFFDKISINGKQKKEYVGGQFCPFCKDPLGDDLTKLSGYRKLIYHKKCMNNEKLIKIFELCLYYFDTQHEPLAGEISKELGFSSQDIAKLLSQSGIKSHRTIRKDKPGRYFTKSLRPVILAALCKIYIDKGNNFLKQGKYKKSLRCFEEVVCVNEHDANGWYGKYEALKALNHRDESDEALAMAKKLGHSR